MIIERILRVVSRHNKCLAVLNNVSRFRHHNLSTVIIRDAKRNFHSSSLLKQKLFHETENEYLFSVIDASIFNNILTVQSADVTNEATFESILNQNWRNKDATDILKTFKNLKSYCIQNNIDISDPRFNNIVDGLMDHCEKLSDNELLELLICLTEYPKCPSYMSHNFHDVWSCLDDICCWKMAGWDNDKLFSFTDAWYKLNLAKYCEFIYEVMNKLVKKADSLTKNQLVHVFFLFNINRRRPVDFEYEYALSKKIHEMNVDEMAVIALGYFKSKSKIKLLSISEAIIEAVTKDSKNIHEISLTAIMKTLRYSNSSKVLDKINIMLDSLYPEMYRFSDLCCLHMALILTVLRSFHEDILREAVGRLTNNISNIRIKEIERILNVLTMLNYDPKTKPDIFKLAYDELHKESRRVEIKTYPKCLISALNYLSLKEIYSYELMDQILDVSFIESNFGKGARCLPRDILSLDSCIDIECPEYKGKRLPPKLKYRAVKWHTEFAPSYTQWKQLSAPDKLFLDVVDTVKKIVKYDNCLFPHHVLPHFPKATILICKNVHTGKFVEPKGFQSYILGDIMTPFNDGSLNWYAIMVVGWNNTLTKSSTPLGHTLMMERQLRKIGYKPVMVIWNQFMPLTSEEKINYISTLM